MRRAKECKCKCGETNPAKFYGNKKTVCGNCHRKYTLKLGQLKKDKAREILGNKCELCGFDRYKKSLDIHHIDPNKKDPNFKTMRSWAWGKIENEISHCILLCRNCHAALHNKELTQTELLLLEYKINNKPVLKKHNLIFSIKQPVIKNTVCKNLKTKICIRCGRPATNKFCSRNCNAKYNSLYNEVINWPNNDELKNLVWSMSMTKVGKQLNVSDVAVKKKCMRENIELPPMGYFLRKSNRSIA